MTPLWAQRREELWSDCLVSPDVFNEMVDRLGEFIMPYQQALETEADPHSMHLYLQGPLSHLPRKNAEAIAAWVDVERQVMQDFIGIAPWDHRPLIGVLVCQVAKRLGEPDGIIAFDPSSFPKRGTHSVGVKRQWCGHRGKVDNCQVGVFMGYVSRHNHALLDFRLSLPEDWAQDERRRQACHVPLEVRYQTRQEQCLEMLDTWGEQVPHGWVTGDDELGRHTQFRHELRERGERYVLGVPCNTTMRDLEAPLPAYAGRGRPSKAPWQSVTNWRQSLPGDAWTHLTVRDGEKGPVEMAMIRRRVQTRLERKRTGPAEWLVVTRRPLTDDGTWASRASRDATDQDARYRYHYYLTPTDGGEMAFKEPSLGELGRVIKAGACIEASFKRGKGEVGRIGNSNAILSTVPSGMHPSKRPVCDEGEQSGSRPPRTGQRMASAWLGQRHSGAGGRCRTKTSRGTWGGIKKGRGQTGWHTRGGVDCSRGAHRCCPHAAYEATRDVVGEQAARPTAGF